jgi:hypothetical protein
MDFSAMQILKHEIYYGGEQQSLMFFVMMNSEIIEAASVY